MRNRVVAAPNSLGPYASIMWSYRKGAGERVWGQ
jgi:hypothetical protein